MSFPEQMDPLKQGLKAAERGASDLMERIKSEFEIAERLAAHNEQHGDAWKALVARAMEQFQKDLSGGDVTLMAAIKAAEQTLAPIGAELKTYTIHCCGHAHIDMNWLWPWPETVSTTRDTFSTVDRLMDAFPDFHFSQDQTSTYIAMEEYSPEVFEMIRRRIAEGRWDVTASTWVEGEKNLAAGETLCRQMLYTRHYFKEKFGLPYDAVKIDWEPDMFGHCHTLPGILRRGGVSRYYFCRAGKDPSMFWWQGPDGSRILCFKDDTLWYNGVITPDLARMIFTFEKETGLKDYLFLYGVGDHGGGPTRWDLIRYGRMKEWPIWPTLRLGKVEEFYDAVEAANPNLPMVDDELNFVFEGCYTSQSIVKRGNRLSENALPKAETVALLARSATGMPYASEDLKRGWRHTMFCQFHDILPGSGIHATYEYSSGLHQEVAAITESVTTRGLRALASKVNTAALCGTGAPGVLGSESLGDGAGAGAGDPANAGGVTAWNAGAPSGQPFLIYNPMPWERTEVISAKIWNQDWPHDCIRVRDDSGQVFPAPVVGTGNYWGHNFTSVAFPVKSVPGTGYRVYQVERGPEPLSAEGAFVKSRERVMHSPSAELETVTLENEHLRVVLDCSGGSIAHLIDKKTGFDSVPEGGRMGLIEFWHEAPNGMSAWVIGQLLESTPFNSGWLADVRQRGPHRASVVFTRRHKDSSFTYEISLDAGSRSVDFNLRVNWLERGTNEWGVPLLKAAFPLAVTDPKARYEVAFGSIERGASGQEVPALKWADLSGQTSAGRAGLTLVNEDKYGHNADGSTLRLSLLRSSYSPDPLPEMGEHVIRYSIRPHQGDLSVSEAMRLGWDYGAPLTPVSTDTHEGPLDTTAGFVSVEQPNIFIAAVKKAEDSDGVVVRAFEVEGKDTEASIRIRSIVEPGALAVECDLLEQPLEASTAHMDGDVLKVKIPAHGIATVKIGA